MTQFKGGGNNNGYSRVLEFDFIRCVACFAVVVTHARHAFLNQPVYSYAWNTAIISHAFTRMAVPLFVMISGYFLLSRSYFGPDVSRFYKRRWATIGLPCVFWATFYLMFDAARYYFANSTLDLSFFTTGANAFLTSGSVGIGTPLWYLYMLIGLYFITPLLASWFNVFSRRYLLFMSFILLGVVCAISTTTYHLNGSHMPATIFLRFVYYIPYFLLGKLLGDFFFNSHRSKAAILGFIGFILATVGIILSHFYSKGIGYFYQDTSSGNCSFLVICQTISFYIFALSWRRNPALKSPKTLTLLASLSFGVYLTHKLCLLAALILLRTVNFAPTPERPIVTFAAYILLAYTFANVATFVLKRIPYLRRVV